MPFSLGCQQKRVKFVPEHNSADILGGNHFVISWKHECRRFLEVLGFEPKTLGYRYRVQCCDLEIQAVHVEALIKTFTIKEKNQY